MATSTPDHTANGSTPGRKPGSGEAAGTETEGTPSNGGLDREHATALALALTDLIAQANVSIARSAGAASLRIISEHLGVDFSAAIQVGATWPHWRHLSLNRAMAQHLAQYSPDETWFGMPNVTYREHSDFANLFTQESDGRRTERVSADYTSIACGPNKTEDAVAFGLVCTTTPTGVPVVVAVRTAQTQHPPVIAAEILAVRREDAVLMLEHLRRLVDENEVIRGQLVSFGVSEHMENELVTFLVRPNLSQADVILPATVLPTIERHVIGPAEHAERLKATGIHLKRGLLLHGPPGTGKTHTVRYLISRMTSATVIVLTGTSLKYIEQTAALARKLAPTLVIVEDVDLIAADRSSTPNGNPLLFSLLDAMDGVAADADVTFVLTTNRADILEEALVQRPGRVDLAVEIPRPDDAGRRALIALYKGTAIVTANIEPIVEATAGATASAIKELMRRAVLVALDLDSDPVDPAAPPVIDDAVVTQVLADFAAQNQALSRALVGAADHSPRPANKDEDPPSVAEDPARGADQEKITGDNSNAGWMWNECRPPNEL